jgi:hypothetical protein
MDSLTADPVAAILKRLFQEAETADRPPNGKGIATGMRTS